jgi:predicted RNase H-like HicB family nuclease
VGDDRDLAERVADKLLHARRLSDLRAIKAQDRQALYLKALGFRYHEIAALLSITYTAVNRRITEGRRGLRELEAAAIHACGPIDQGAAMTDPDDAFEITVVYEDAGDGQLTATIPAVPGTISTGSTQAEARRDVVDALGTMLSVAPDDVPEGATTERIKLRLVLVGDHLGD